MNSKNRQTRSSRMSLALLTASALLAGGGSALATDAAKILTENEEVPEVKTSATAQSSIVAPGRY